MNTPESNFISAPPENILGLLIRKIAERPAGVPDPLALEPALQARYASWEAGFNAYEAGMSQDACDAVSKSRPVWRQGWDAAKRIDELLSEREKGLL